MALILSIECWVIIAFLSSACICHIYMKQIFTLFSLNAYSNLDNFTSWGIHSNWGHQSVQIYLIDHVHIQHSSCKLHFPQGFHHQAAVGSRCVQGMPVSLSLLLVQINNPDLMLLVITLHSLIPVAWQSKCFHSNGCLLLGPGQVNAGLECGIGMDDYNGWEAGDIIEAFNKRQKKRTLEEASASMTAALEVAGIER